MCTDENHVFCSLLRSSNGTSILPSAKWSARGPHLLHMALQRSPHFRFPPEPLFRNPDGGHCFEAVSCHTLRAAVSKY